MTIPETQMPDDVLSSIKAWNLYGQQDILTIKILKLWL